MEVNRLTILKEASTVYEAESGVLSGGAVYADDHFNYSGSGFAAGFIDSNRGNAKVSFHVTASEKGVYDLGIRYANGNGSTKTMSLGVDGNYIKQLSMHATSDWDSWNTITETVNLSQGSHTIDIYFGNNDSGNINLDYCTLDKKGGAPDLTVTNISWAPADPLMGDEVTFKAVIKNQGTGASPEGVIHGVAFMVDGTTVAWSDSHTSSIPAGESVTVTANGGPASKETWSAASGSHTVRAYVDDMNRITEANENNNTYDRAFTIGIPSSPDLVVTDISWNPATPLTGEEVTYKATIKNQGTASTPDGVIHGVVFSVDGETVSWSDTHTSSIPAGESVTVTANGGPDSKGTWSAATGNHTIRAMVDDINRITEADDTNNTLEKSLTVSLPSKPDLTITDISWSPAAPVAGDSVTFQAVVENQGTAATAAGTDCNVDFYINGSRLRASVPYSVSIPAGGKVTLTQGAGSWAAVNGTYGISASVDESNLIEELDEMNNSFVKSLTIGTEGSYGATVPYDTYEAENMTVNGGTVIGPDTAWCTPASEASGRKAIKLTKGGAIELTLKNPAQGVVIRYSMPDSTTGSDIYQNLSLYVNNTHNTDISFTNRYAHQYGQYGSDGGEMQWSNTPGINHHRYFDETRVLLGQSCGAGTKLKLQWDANDFNPGGSEYILIDFIETEAVQSPLSKPSNYVSITNYGAVPDDGIDDTAAMTAAVAAVNGTTVRGVWIPEGTFDFKTGTRGTTKVKLPGGVSVKGAGMWHSVIQGAYAGFLLQSGDVTLSDFMIKAEETYRSNASGIAGIEGNAANSVITNIWIEHTKVGLWLNEGTTGALVSGCRIRDTWADGININGGTVNTIVEQCNFRNTGDDGMAMWSKSLNGGNQTVEGCTFRYNTIQIPNLANGVGIYGGKNNTIKNNLIMDVIDNGSGIQFGTNHGPSAFTGTLNIDSNKLIRCGSYHHDYGYQIGAIWGYWVNNNGLAQGLTVNVTNNLLEGSTYSGVFIEEPSSGVVVNYNKNTINNSGTYGVHIRGSANGAAAFNNNTVNTAPSGKFKNDSANFTVTGTGNNW